jgi:RNA polymerase sigma-B factor
VSPNARTTCLSKPTRRAPRRQQILAETLARQFLHRSEDEEDLLQVACTGLVEACRRLTRTKGFGVPTITGALKRHFRDHG